MKKNNKKIKLARILILLIVALLITLLLLLNFLNSKKNQVVAKVNGEKIYQSEVNARLKEVFQDSGSEPVQLEKLPLEIVEALVKDVFVQKKLDKKIKKSKLAKSKEIKDKIDDYAKKITRKKYLDLLIKDKIDDKVVKDKYIELAAEISGKKEIHLRHILVKTKSEATEILKKIKERKSFVELAKKYSIDKSTSEKGGDLGFIIEDNLATEFSDFIDSMKKGSVSNPIKTSYGFHIIKIEEIRDAEIPPFELVKTSIEEQLKKDEIKKVYSEITDSAQVKILINLKPVAEENK